MRRIIGIGSPFGADQLGWQAIDYLERCRLQDCELIKLDRPGSGLLNFLQGVEQVVLIDALLSSGRAGDIEVVELSQLAGCDGRLTSCHGFGVAEALGLASQLGAMPERLSLIAIHIEDNRAYPPELDGVSLEKSLRALL
jgi:hydrogenase maturation protease